MRNKIARRCLDIIARIVVTQNIGGISYVEEALRQEIEKNEFRRKCIEMSKNAHPKHK